MGNPQHNMHFRNKANQFPLLWSLTVLVLKHDILYYRIPYQSPKQTCKAETKRECDAVSTIITLCSNSVPARHFISDEQEIQESMEERQKKRLRLNVAEELV